MLSLLWGTKNSKKAAAPFDDPALPPLDPLRMSAYGVSVIYLLNWSFNGILQTGSPEISADLLNLSAKLSSLLHIPVS